MLAYLAWKEYTIKNGTESASVAAIRAVIIFGSVLAFWQWTRALDKSEFRENLRDKEVLSELGVAFVGAAIACGILFSSDLHMTFKVTLTLIGLPTIVTYYLIEYDPAGPEPFDLKEKSPTYRFFWWLLLGIIGLFVLVMLIPIAIG